MSPRVLLTDCFSPLGRTIGAALEEKCWSVVSHHPNSIDWRDRQAVSRLVAEAKPSFIVNTLGWTGLSEAPHEKIMVDGAANLARACHEQNIIILHLSSYQVFGGENRTAYDERDQPAPLTPSGKAFALAERHMAALPRAIILRLSWLVDISIDTFLGRILYLLTREDGVLDVDPLKRGSPTFAADIARVVLAIIQQVDCGAENWGVFHYSSEDPVSEKELVLLVSGLLDEVGLLRGKYSIRDILEQDLMDHSAVLMGKRCRYDFGIHPQGWRNDLIPYLRHHLQQFSQVNLI